MLYVLNLNHHVNGGLQIAGARFDVADIRLLVADYGGDLLKHAKAVIAEDGEFDGIALLDLLGRLGPLHCDAAVGLIH